MKKYSLWIILLIGGAVCFGLIYYINLITKDLREEEERSMQLWADATSFIASPDMDDMAPLELALKIIRQNTKIPVIITDKEDQVISLRNIEGCDSIKSQEWAQEQLRRLIANDARVIDITVDNNEEQHLYYGHTAVIERLKIFPYIQMALVLFFAACVYVTYRWKRKSEQDKLWIGLARETAHQLGTPISALMGWTEMLRAGDLDNITVAGEIGRDINRLRDVAARFSKIGSMPELSRGPICDAIEASIAYLKPRIPKNVNIKFINADRTIQPPHNPTLIGWAVENVCRNAVDALPEGKGNIEVTLSSDNKFTYILIKDDGKGMNRSTASHIFDTGFTTKQRGWGIGLTLTRRIVKQYHKGDISVAKTEIGQGTTMRIAIKN